MTPAVPLVALELPDGSRAQITPFGAHVVSWTTADGRDQLYLSERAVLDGGAAIRGGIPVIFPQFASEGALPKHGFARTAWWREVPGGAPRTAVAFELVDSAESRILWPHAFAARVTVTLLPGVLQVALTVTNRGGDALAFTAALHTYLALDDALGTTVTGLEGLAYRDSITREPGRQRERVLRVAGAVNRVYSGAPARLEVQDEARTLVVETSGFPDVVVWNPGPEGEAALGDMTAGDARRMLCLEPAVVERAVVLAPGGRWDGVQRLVSR